MLRDFEMIKHKIKEKETVVIPVSDVHLGAIEHREREWQSFCKMIEETPNVYITLGGDLVNNSVRNSVANPFDEVYRPREQKKLMVEYLKPIKDRILCAVSGNHEARSTKEVDADITYDIMSKLDIEHLYRENVAFVKLALGERATENKAETTHMLCVTHGAGGGIYTGATVNRNERFNQAIEGIDCLIVGHTHKGTVSKPQKIVVNSNSGKIDFKTTVVISSVAWLNYGGYAARKMLTPAETANPQRIILGGTSNNKKIEVRW